VSLLDNPRYAWQSQPGPQADAVSATWCPILFFGGARGGGKSDYLLGDYLQDVRTYGANWQGVLFRRSYPELQEIISRSQRIYPLTGGKWFEQAKEWHWDNGACLRMRYIERVADASRYQGHQYTWIGWDELTNWADLEAFNQLSACLRWAEADVPTKRIRCSGNPGGAGHQSVKQYFIDFAPLGYKPFDDPTTKMARMYIPSRVSDNKILQLRDPGYVDRLQGVGSPALVRAWLEGDWSAVLGSYFGDCFGIRNIIDPFPIPAGWLKFRCFDWGFESPFCCLWVACASDAKHVPAGSLVVYREFYGARAPNKGLRLTTEQVAQGIKDHQAEGEEITYSVADPSMFREDGGPAISEVMKRSGVSFREADNSRAAGWQQVRSRCLGQDDRPRLYVFDTCQHLIRTLPALQHDPKKPEDLDTTGEDHAADALRYGLMSRPYQRPGPPEPKLIDTRVPTWNELTAHLGKHRKATRY
jgi:hypothetical protein